jgi:hypothetical protein
VLTSVPQPRFRRDVFISYSWKDSENAIRLYERLLECGLPCWIDIEDVPFKEDFQVSIMSGIAEAAVLCVIMTPAALESEWVAQEVKNFAKVASVETNIARTESISAPRERFIHVLHSIPRARAVDTLNSWTAGSFEQVAYHEFEGSSLPSALLVSDIQKEVASGLPAHDEPPSMWPIECTLSRWQSHSIHDMLKRLRRLEPNYESWFRGHPDVFARNAAVCLEAYANSVETLTLHDEDEDSNVRLLTRVGEFPISFGSVLTPNLRCGSPGRILRDMSLRVDLSEAIQDAYYRLRTDALTRIQRDRIDIFTLAYIGWSYDMHLSDGEAEIEEAVEALIAQEPYDWEWVDRGYPAWIEARTRSQDSVGLARIGEFLRGVFKRPST